MCLENFQRHSKGILMRSLNQINWILSSSFTLGSRCLSSSPYCISQAESSHTKGNSFCPFKSATSFVWSLLRAYDHSWGFKHRSINLMFLSQFPVTGRIFHFRLTGQQNSRRVIHLYITTSTKSNVLERFKSFLFRWFPLSQVSDKIRQLANPVRIIW